MLLSASLARRVSSPAFTMVISLPELTPAWQGGWRVVAAHLVLARHQGGQAAQAPLDPLMLLLKVPQPSSSQD